MLPAIHRLVVFAAISLVLLGPRLPNAVSAAASVGAYMQSAEQTSENQTDAWLGFGLMCTNCQSQRVGRSTIWTFTEPPTITGIDAAGPAARAGLRAGDVLTHIDGIALTASDGGTRFGSIAPHQAVIWTFERGGIARRIRMTAGEKRPENSSPATASRSLPIRFSGDVRGMSVEVRGGQATVTIDEATGTMSIRGDNLLVRLSPKR